MRPGSSRYLTQLRELTLSEWKLREQSSLLGFAWTLLNPLLLYLVLYAIFTQWMRRSGGSYAAELIVGLVPFNFFMSASHYALTSLPRRKGLLTNFIIPRELVVFSAGLSCALSFALETALMLAFLALAGVGPSWSWACAPVLAGLCVALVLSGGLWLAVLGARFPDFERIWGVLTMAGFFLTPVFYTLDSLEGRRRAAVAFNPLAQLIELLRDCLVRGRWPDPLKTGALALGIAALGTAGWVLFKRREPGLADELLR